MILTTLFKCNIQEGALFAPSISKYPNKPYVLIDKKSPKIITNREEWATERVYNVVVHGNYKELYENEVAEIMKKFKSKKHRFYIYHAYLRTTRGFYNYIKNKSPQIPKDVTIELARDLKKSKATFNLLPPPQKQFK